MSNGQLSQATLSAARIAAEAWAAATALFRPQKECAPWDMAPYFDPIRCTQFTIVPPNNTARLEADPSRVVLIWSGDPTGAGNVSIIPDNVNGTVPNGIIIYQTMAPVILHWHDHGPIVSGGWTMLNQSAGTVHICATETLLRQQRK